MEKVIAGNIVDVVKKKIFPGEIIISGKKIKRIIRKNTISSKHFILPGLTDAHVHIESSMLTPGRFAQLAVRHGTVATVSDPHEIANVMGSEGVEFMIRDGEKVPFKFYFGAPSCVPATPFETSGAVLGVKEVEKLLKREEIKYLSEMMNFPGVIHKSEDVAAKLNSAGNLGKPVDGHAPGLRGEDLKKYVEAGISTDHECYSIEEAEEKIKYGMLVQIREGSAARNFEALYSLIDKYPDMVMLCSDDLHPDDLYKGHVNRLIRKGLEKGLNLFNLLRAATIIPKEHYNLETGLLQENDPADFIVVENLDNFDVQETWIDGEKVFEKGKVLFQYKKPVPINNFFTGSLNPDDLIVETKSSEIRVIRAYDGELLTGEEIVKPSVLDDIVVTDAERDIAKIVVMNRYKPAKPVVGFITGFGLKEGAFASTVAHDSHNLIAIGMKDEDIFTVMDAIIRLKGGIAISHNSNTEHIRLDIGGLMSSGNPQEIAADYARLNDRAASLCSSIKSPFMTLAFMALLVIPELKIGDQGLFNVNKFEKTSLFV